MKFRSVRDYTCLEIKAPILYYPYGSLIVPLIDPFKGTLFYVRPPH